MATEDSVAKLRQDDVDSVIKDFDLELPLNTKMKSMRSMSRSTFDSVIDDFIEDDWEKRSAFGVSLTVVMILTIFLSLLGIALSVSLGVQHGNQSKKLAFNICAKVITNFKIWYPHWAGPGA